MVNRSSDPTPSTSQLQDLKLASPHPEKNIKEYFMILVCSMDHVLLWMPEVVDLQVGKTQPSPCWAGLSA